MKGDYHDCKICKRPCRCIHAPELDGLNIKRFDTLEEIIDDISKLLDET